MLPKCWSRGCRDALVLLACVVPGCVGTTGVSADRVGEPADSVHPAGKFAIHAARWIGGRYLLIPVVIEDHTEKFFASGVFIASSGGGSATSSGGWVDGMINIEIVDTQARAHHRMLEKSVPLILLSPFDGDPAKRTTHAPWLLAKACPTDTNGDRRIDYRDSQRLCAYHLERNELKWITPAGFDVGRVDDHGDRLIVTLHHERDANELAVYAYDIANEKGEFVAEGLRPTPAKRAE